MGLPTGLGLSPPSSWGGACASVDQLAGTEPAYLGSSQAPLSRGEGILAANYAIVKTSEGKFSEIMARRDIRRDPANYSGNNWPYPQAHRHPDGLSSSPPRMVDLVEPADRLAVAHQAAARRAGRGPARGCHYGRSAWSGICRSFRLLFSGGGRSAPGSPGGGCEGWSIAGALGRDRPAKRA